MTTQSGFITALNHLAICANCLDDSKLFYSDVLGLVEVPRPQGVKEQFASAWYALGSIELHVVENSNFRPLREATGPHFAVNVDNFDAIVERLNGAAPIVFGPAQGPDGITRIVVSDPTGNIVEILST